MNKKIAIEEKFVGVDCKPYVVAEAGSNFNQDFDTAKLMIEVASRAGADAIKFQLFRAEILDPCRTGLYEVFKSIELQQEWVPKLMDHARSIGIHFSASAFDMQSVDILEKAGVPFHKIASSEVTNLPLIHKLASKGKPIFLSTGMSDMVDVEQAVNVCKDLGNDSVVLMQCGALYPLPIELANLKVLETFAARFKGVLGFSDHTTDILASTVAVGLGATVFEKHFTLDKSSDGPDHFYANDPNELAAYIKNLQNAYFCLGASEKQMLEQERREGRREGIYAKRNLRAGEAISHNDVESKRPALGLRARHIEEVIGARITQDLSSGEPLTWKMLSFENK